MPRNMVRSARHRNRFPVRFRSLEMAIVDCFYEAIEAAQGF